MLTARNMLAIASVVAGFGYQAEACVVSPYNLATRPNPGELLRPRAWILLDLPLVGFGSMKVKPPILPDHLRHGAVATFAAPFAGTWYFKTNVGSRVELVGRGRRIAALKRHSAPSACFEKREYTVYKLAKGRYAFQVSSASANSILLSIFSPDDSSRRVAGKEAMAAQR